MTEKQLLERFIRQSEGRQRETWMRMTPEERKDLVEASKKNFKLAPAGSGS